jgi:hypothetical protein
MILAAAPNASLGDMVDALDRDQVTVDHVHHPESTADGDSHLDRTPMAVSGLSLTVGRLPATGVEGPVFVAGSGCAVVLPVGCHAYAGESGFC